MGEVTQGKPPSYGEYISWYDQEKLALKYLETCKCCHLRFVFKLGFVQRLTISLGGI